VTLVKNVAIPRRELLRTKNVKELSEWLESLSNAELERMKHLGYEI